MTRLACLALALAAAAACDKKGAPRQEGAKGAEKAPEKAPDKAPDPGGAKEAAAPAPVGMLGEHVAAVNAALPADLKDKLQFEAGRIIENEKHNRVFQLAVPKGWRTGRFTAGMIEPPDVEAFGSRTLGMTQMGVGRHCDGPCVKKDWAAISDKVLYSQFTSGKVAGKVIKDEKRANGRTLVFERKPSAFADKEVAVHVYTSWWDPVGAEYFTCSAELGLPVKGAAEAFEKACSKIIRE